MSIASLLAPAGVLRLGVWMVPYFARHHGGGLSGLIPDVGAALAQRAATALALVPFDNPAQILAAFRDGALDVTCLGITADRAAVVDFGPVLFALQTTYLVPASSAITSMAAIDQSGVRVAVPANSAQEAHLRRTVARAELVPVPAETPRRAIDMLAAGEVDAFSHVAPMLAVVANELPGARILAGSYFDVPVAIATAKDRPATVASAIAALVADMKQSGEIQRAIDHAGITGIEVGA